MRVEQKMAVMVAAQAGVSPMMWGPPGQGKSSFVRDGFEKLGYAVHVIRLNITMPHHLSGIQVVSECGNFVRYLPPEWVIDLNKAEKSILFFDDVSCASTLGQTAAFGIMDERMIGGTKIKALPVAAANPNSLATARFDLDAAAANRVVHITITSDPKVYRDDVESDFPAPRVPKLRGNWAELRKGKSRLITDFLNSAEGAPLINCMPEQVTPSTVAWPSERSWMNCWTLLAACDAIAPESLSGVNLLEVRRILFEGCVGAGAFAKFNAYYRTPMDADVEKALRQGKAYSFPEKGESMFGLLTAVSHKLSGDQLTLNRWKQAWSLAEGAWETSHRDRVVPFALDLVSIGRDLYDLPDFFTRKVLPVLKGA